MRDQCSLVESAVRVRDQCSLVESAVRVRDQCSPAERIQSSMRVRDQCSLVESAARVRDQCSLVESAARVRDQCSPVVILYNKQSRAIPLCRSSDSRFNSCSRIHFLSDLVTCPIVSWIFCLSSHFILELHSITKIFYVILKFTNMPGSQTV